MEVLLVGELVAFSIDIRLIICIFDLGYWSCNKVEKPVIDDVSGS